MLLSEFIKNSTQELTALYPQPEARQLVLLLCEDRLGTKSYTHIVEPQMEVPSERLEGLLEDVRRMKGGEPLQYVCSKTWFAGRSFKVSPAVLIPRPETELLVQEAVMRLGNEGKSKVLDLCTGSGCIAWSIALDVPQAELTAVDISEEALEIAQSQFESKNVSFVKADVLAGALNFSELSSQYDMIVSNPPYIMDKEKAQMRKNVLDFEPHLALFVSDEDPLLFYRAIADWAKCLLKAGGQGLVEINESLGPETVALFVAEGFKEVELIQDFYQKDRIVVFKK